MTASDGPAAALQGTHSVDGPGSDVAHMLHAALPSHTYKPLSWSYVQSPEVFKTAAIGR